MTTGSTRQIVLDTETTGLEVDQGHRIIEIGAVELIDRRPTGKVYHQYICPQRRIDRGALEVHGLTAEFLADQPTFDAIADDFLAFISDAQLIIHNADFDVGFLNAEIKQLGVPDTWLEDYKVRVLDTLAEARKLHPGQRNSLDALCKRYEVDATARDLHGALLDARLLCEVYLAMTGGQAILLLSDEEQQGDRVAIAPQRIDREGLALPVIAASASERLAHETRLHRIDKTSNGACLWLKMEPAPASEDSGSPPGQDLV